MLMLFVMYFNKVIVLPSKVHVHILSEKCGKSVKKVENAIFVLFVIFHIL